MSDNPKDLETSSKPRTINTVIKTIGKRLLNLLERVLDKIF